LRSWPWCCGWPPHCVPPPQGTAAAWTGTASQSRPSCG
jgi:hypothetical protein